MLRIQHAILHSFDLTTSELFLSSMELDLDEKKTMSFVKRHCRKAVNSVDNNTGEFAHDSNFAEEIIRFDKDEIPFIDFSQQIARFFYEELRKGDSDAPCDLLVSEFSDTIDAKASDEAAEEAFVGGENRYFGILLLPRKEVFIHQIAGYDTSVVNDVAKTNAALPNPSQKIDSYAVINLTDMSIMFHDKERTIAGNDTYLIPDGLLQCSRKSSTKEVLQAVTAIVEDVAEEYGLITSEAVGKAKAYMSENVEHAEEFTPEEVGKVVFEDEPEYIEKYEKKAIVQNLPETVHVKKSQANRITKNHKIKTDTGIEITFPSEYAKDAQFIEFVTDSDGFISIQLKNITSIENK